MRLSTLTLVALVAVALPVAAWVRLAPMDPAKWHVDPVGAAPLARPNGYRMTEGGEAPAALIAYPAQDVAQALLDTGLAAPRTRLIAGSAAQGWFTLVQRSALMGYPDAISVRVVDTPTGAALHVLSRSRFGHSDLGVNLARVRDWTRRALQKLENG